MQQPTPIQFQHVLIHIPGPEGKGTFQAAIITRIWSNACVNLDVFHGTSTSPDEITSVQHVSSGILHPANRFWLYLSELEEVQKSLSAHNPPRESTESM